MAHNIVLQAYERSLQAYGHSLPHYVLVRGDHEQLERSCEESEKINKILEKLQQLENSCAEITNGYKKISARRKKISVVIHNREDEQFHKKVEKEKEDNYQDAKMVDSNNGDKRENEVTDEKKILKQGEGYERPNNERAVSYAKGKSSRTSIENSSKYIPPPMRNKGKKKEKC